MSAWTEHGGDVRAACAAFGGIPGDWLDLSTGINPHMWPGVSSIAIDWRALPAPQALAELEAAAAAHFGVTDAAICAVPGSEAGLRALGATLTGDAVHVAPGYATHARAIPSSTAISVADIDAAAEAGRTILLANPNNPDGRLIAPDQLAEIARTAARNGGRLIVDEAFADCCPEASVVAEAGEGLVVLRSFGKFFGLAGVRLGFVIGAPDLIAACRARIGDWPVSAAAIAIGTAAYRDTKWIAAMRRQLVTEAAALDSLLARHGLAASGACPLFRLVTTDDAAGLFERLALARILTRPFAYRPDWLRIGLPGSAGGLARLDAALAHG